MKINSLGIKSLLALFVAIVSWCGVAIFGYFLIGMESERAEYARQVAAATVKEGEAAQLHALARETSVDRQKLADVASVDVLSAVTKIESIQYGGARVSVTGAQAERISQGKNGASTGANIVVLSAHAEGTFSEIMHVAGLLENLPLVSGIQMIEMSRLSGDAVPKNTLPQWGLDVRMRFITAAPLPS